MAGIFENDKCAVKKMNNREKYKFDYFTLENYRKLLELALEKGFEFISYTDPFHQDRKDILWRHDVEFEPDIALKMAEIESSLGVKTTYFFQIHSMYYNTFDPHYTEVFNKIHAMGHYVGLHFDSHYYGIENEDQLSYFISLDKEYMEKVLKVSIDAFSFHNTTPFTQSCLEFKYAGLINVYSSFFKERYNYCSDSLGYWRFDVLDELLRNPSVQHLHVLVHDANWSEEVLSPRQRISKAIQDQADRLIKGQIDGLHKKGLKCIDDHEE